MRTFATAVAVLQFSSILVTAQPNFFSDTFESASLDPFWSGFANLGSITFPSTAQAHSASQSVQFNSPANLFNTVLLSHVFVTPVYGQVSVWVYDTGADLPQSHTLDFTIGAGTTGWGLLANPTFTTYQYALGSAGFHDTGIDRTQGWHQFTIRSESDSLTMAVDGNTVYSGMAQVPFTALGLRMNGGPLASGWVAYWDDFASAVTPVPEPSTVLLFGVGALGIFGNRAVRSIHRRIRSAAV